MAMMTPEEIKHKVPKGYFVKEKCDNCDMPIMSSLVYRGSKGSYCSNPCYEEAELDGDNRARRRKRTSKKGRARATDITKESDTMIKGGSKDKAGTASKKKKRTREADAEEHPRKKKRPPADEDEDEGEAPRKTKSARKGKGKAPAKRKKKATDNPYSRPSAAVYRAFNMAKEGTTVKAVEKLCDELGVGSTRVFNELRKEEFKDTQWSYSEDKKGRIEITDIS